MPNILSRIYDYLTIINSITEKNNLRNCIEVLEVILVLHLEADFEVLV